MKIALLSSLLSIHTVRWANAFAERNHDVYVISAKSHCETTHGVSPKVNIVPLPYSSPHGYFLNAITLKKTLKQINPDVLNAHYASGYGTLGRLSAFHPYVLSVWGSDVFDFPFKSRYHMALIRKNLLAADLVCSTSHVMAQQTLKICPEIQRIEVTPFGVDTQIFKPLPDCRNPEYITIGTVKTLAHKYGIDTLLHAFALACSEMKKIDPGKKLRLLIAGDGPEKFKLQELARSLKIESQCIWVGKVPHSEVPKILNQFDIYVALSRSESFGVAIIEASACGIPVVVSDAGGLPEVVEGEKTGFIVPRDSPNEAYNALISLLIDSDMSKKMGQKGIEFVKRTYEWDLCVNKLEEFFLSVSSHEEGNI
ncbi:MAG: glycosyltransferase family 4 protein [Clostridiaceae bacterium]|nr:glycosyltransferase family 4 protein [Clostridiaceae bacterium]